MITNIRLNWWLTLLIVSPCFVTGQGILNAINLGRRTEIGFCATSPLEGPPIKFSCFEEVDKHFCCGPKNDQRCCTVQEFSDQHTVLLNSILVMIIVTITLSIVVCGCGFCACLLAAGVKSEEDAKEEKKHLRYLERQQENNHKHKKHRNPAK